MHETIKVDESSDTDLSEFFQQKALNELREDSLRKQQALEQFREWISKQSHIKRCRTDDSFLLRFLRCKKFLNAEAFKMFEKFLVSTQTNPHWFHNLTLDDQKLNELYASGFICVLKERDQNGCKVLMVRTSQVDVKKFTPEDMTRLSFLILLTLTEEPETQVSGLVHLEDFVNSFEHLRRVQMTYVKQLFQIVTKALPCRIKQIGIVNLNSISVKLIEFIKLFISKKLKDRIHVMDNNDEIKNFHDVKILPREYGGTMSIQDMLDDFKTLIEKHKDKVLATSEQDIDLKGVEGFEDEAVGSFRKLEID